MSRFNFYVATSKETGYTMNILAPNVKKAFKKAKALADGCPIKPLFNT